MKHLVALVVDEEEHHVDGVRGHAHHTEVIEDEEQDATQVQRAKVGDDTQNYLHVSPI